MNDRFTDEQLKEKYGLRPHGNPLFEPQEHGYRCPKGHSNITWSEFKDHIWCYECEIDYHYAIDCVLIKDKYNPKDLPQQPKIIEGIKNFTDDGWEFNDIPKELLESE